MAGQRRVQTQANVLVAFQAKSSPIVAVTLVIAITTIVEIIMAIYLNNFRQQLVIVTQSHFGCNKSELDL